MPGTHLAVGDLHVEDDVVHQVGQTRFDGAAKLRRVHLKKKHRGFGLTDSAMLPPLLNLRSAIKMFQRKKHGPPKL